MNHKAQTARHLFTTALAAVLLLAGSTVAHGQTTYYISPNGSDDNAGTSESAPLGTFDAAIDKLGPGDELVLLDGVYPVTSQDERFYADCEANAQNGTEAAPITVRAQNERRAWIDGNGSATPAPFTLTHCSYWNVEGLRASSDDYKDGSQQIVRVDRSGHIQLKRLLLHHANRHENSDGIEIDRSHHILVEETEMYFFHRHGISSYKSDYVTVRRSFVHGRDAATPEGSGFYLGHACCREAGDEGYTFYFTSNSVLENSISMHSEQLSNIAGVETGLGNPGGQNNKMLGNISYKDFEPGFVQSRMFYDPEQPYVEHPDRPWTGPAKNIVVKDFLLIGGPEIGEGGSYSPRVATEFTLEGGTFINTDDTPIQATARTREDEDRAFLGCTAIGGCTYRIRNALFVDDAYSERGPLLEVGPERLKMDFLIEYSNAWSSAEPERGFGVREDIADDEGRYQNAMSVEPTGMGLGEDACIAYVPEGSNMKGAGRDGADIGANILYRYEDGELTNEPLWDPETGEFPHGAVIEGSANDPALHDVVMANIHEHLNVNTSGCRLPYATQTAPQAP